MLLAASSVNIYSPEGKISQQIRIELHHNVLYLAQIGLFDPHCAAGREGANGAGHGRLSFLLLEAVGNDEEGAEANVHPLGGQDDLDGPSHR